MKKDIQDKKLWQRLGEGYSDIEILFEVLKTKHKDFFKSAQLIPKIEKGCADWIEAHSG